MTEEKKKNGNGKPKRRRGRPSKYDKLPTIPDTPENVAKAIMRTSPEELREWERSQKRQG